MLTRNDANQNLAETFLYDTLNRLTNNTVNSLGAGVDTQTYTYDSIGNITSRSDIGVYTYATGSSRPHAVAEIGLVEGGKRHYNYDAKGNLIKEEQRDSLGTLISTKGRIATYTSFDMPATLASPTANLSFVYGSEHQRIKQISPSSTTIYVNPDNTGGLAYEKNIKADGSIEHKHYITASNGVVALLVQTSATTKTVYFHRDHLGSTTAVTDENGLVIERMAYEPFGKRRTLAGARDPNGSIVGKTTDRGYTNHEHLNELGLIHMNGRIYDPQIGRFMAADPGVPYPTNIQSYNRYSYVRNNPMIMIDPSGFCEGLGGHDNTCDTDNSDLTYDSNPVFANAISVPSPTKAEYNFTLNADGVMADGGAIVTINGRPPSGELIPQNNTPGGVYIGIGRPPGGGMSPAGRDTIVMLEIGANGIPFERPLVASYLALKAWRAERLLAAARLTRESAKAEVFATRTAPELKEIFGWGNGAPGVKAAKEALDSSVVSKIQNNISRAEVESIRDFYRANEELGRGGPVAPQRAEYIEAILELWKK
jgi:RHS repeat-associated protein